MGRHWREVLQGRVLVSVYVYGKETGKRRCGRKVKKHREKLFKEGSAKKNWIHE